MDPQVKPSEEGDGQSSSRAAELRLILSTLRAPRLAVEYIKRRSEVLADAGFPPEALHSFVASYAYFDGEWAGGALCGVLAILLASTTGPMMELLRWFARR